MADRTFGRILCIGHPRVYKCVHGVLDSSRAACEVIVSRAGVGSTDAVVAREVRMQPQEHVVFRDFQHDFTGTSEEKSVASPARGLSPGEHGMLGAVLDHEGGGGPADGEFLTVQKYGSSTRFTHQEGDYSIFIVLEY